MHPQETRVRTDTNFTNRVCTLSLVTTEWIWDRTLQLFNKQFQLYRTSSELDKTIFTFNLLGSFTNNVFCKTGDLSRNRGESITNPRHSLTMASDVAAARAAAVTY